MSAVAACAAWAPRLAKRAAADDVGPLVLKHHGTYVAELEALAAVRLDPPHL